MQALRTTALRTIYRAGYPLAHAYWRIARPHKEGVKCVVENDGHVLLVRHTYGPGNRWELPGGGVKRGEEPEAAARREAREELGIDTGDWRFLGDLFERIDGKHDRLWCFATQVADRRLRLDAAEIADARWFSRDGLPVDAHRYVERTLKLDPR